MKQLVLIFGLIITFSSCEDVIEVDVPSEEPRLIIDAVIRVDTSLPVTTVKVKVTETASFFESPRPVTLEQITLAGAILLEESPGSGIYRGEVPTQSLMVEDLFLAIDYNDQIFAAFTDFAAGVPIDTLRQGPGGLIDDETEIIVGFTDTPDMENFYLFDFDQANFTTTRDQFYEGQFFEFSFFYNDKLEPGTKLEISLMGTTERFYQYMEKVIEQSEENLGVFATPAITVKGNILNATDIETISDLSDANLETNFPLGYFAVVQEYKETIIIQ